MDCCSCAIERYFDEERAAEKVRTYRAKGLKKESRLLAETLIELGVGGMSLLDVGGGIGPIQHTLLAAGMSSAVNVEAAPAYAAAAEQEAARLGLADRTKVVTGDFVTLAAQFDPADVVILDKVVCCYDDYPALLRAAADKTGRIMGLIYPRDAWWMKAVIAYENWDRRRRGSPWEVFVHPVRQIDRLVRAAGLERIKRRRLIDWEIAVYARP